MVIFDFNFESVNLMDVSGDFQVQIICYFNQVGNQYLGDLGI